MKIAACADVHLDRIPSKDNTSSHLSWDLLVDYVCANSFDVLLISGDVMDSETSWFSSYGNLINGLEKLKDCGVHTIAVAGNHDFNVFSEVGRSKADLVKVLGIGGNWEYEDYGGYRFIGWSFPKAWVQYNPMDDFDPSMLNFNGPRIGLLHCELQDYGSPSNYAGVLRHQLETAGVDFWVLGHVHKPSLFKNILYCGSVIPLDRSEEGFHGLWTLDKNLKPNFVQINDYVYHTGKMDISGVTDVVSLREALIPLLEETVDKVNKDSSIPVKELLVHPVFVGEVFHDLDLDRLLNDGETIEGLSFEYHGTKLSINGYENQVDLELKLSDLSNRPGPIGFLAKILLDPSEELLSKLEKRIKGLNESQSTEINPKAYLQTAAKKLLREMLKQEDSHA